MSKLKKAQGVIEQLIKMDPHLKEHLNKIRQVAPESARVVANTIFGDSMVQGVGNKAAYEDFTSRPRPGVHAMIDLNDFGIVNKKWGQSEGDNAIKAAGGALKRASRSFRGKLFRVGGDEFRAHFDTPEQAHGFTRALRAEFEKLPPIQGVHRHSASVGLAGSPDQAEQAVIHAKNAKKAANKPHGMADTHVHSLLPGSAGPVPVEQPNPLKQLAGFEPPKKPGSVP